MSAKKRRYCCECGKRLTPPEYIRCQECFLRGHEIIAKAAKEAGEYWKRKI